MRLGTVFGLLSSLPRTPAVLQMRGVRVGLPMQMSGSSASESLLCLWRPSLPGLRCHVDTESARHTVLLTLTACLSPTPHQRDAPRPGLDQELVSKEAGLGGGSSGLGSGRGYAVSLASSGGHSQGAGSVGPDLSRIRTLVG